MKISAMGMVVATTIILVLLTIIAAMGAAFNWVFLLTVSGQAMLLYTVYRVLTDDYHTDKTFDDFYGDHPRGGDPID
jgi:hypothetical protein